jgi:hypothetical protein
MDNIYFKKYIKYKKKYFNLKIQYAGKFSDEAKQKVIQNIFSTIEKKSGYNLYLKLLEELNYLQK